MKRPAFALTVLLLLALLIPAQTRPVFATPMAQADEETPAYVPGQLIIGFRPGVTQEQIADFKGLSVIHSH